MLIAIPKVLQDKLGEEAAHGLIELINYQSQNSGDSITTFVEEKFEWRLSEELSKLREELYKGQATMIRWMFVFWVGQIGAMLGILFAFFN